MSRKAIKSINWAALAELIPESERNVFATFRTKSEQYLRRMAANPETAPKIDWSYYQKTITTPGLVEKFQKEYEVVSSSVPYPSDKYTADINAEEQETVKQMETFAQSANDTIRDHESEIERIQGMMPFRDMTMEDYKDLYPENAFDRENPTVWPHTEETQPAAVDHIQSKDDH